MKKKIILLIIGTFIFINVNADGIPDCIPCEGKPEIECKINSCLEKRIDQLILANEKFQDENLSFKIKEEAFSGGLENYIKTLEESKKIQEEKGNAYNEALNNLKIWISIIGLILGLILFYFGLNRNTELKKAKDDLSKEIGEYKRDFKEYKGELRILFDDYKEQVVGFKNDLKNELSEKFKESLENKLKNELKVEFSEKLQKSIDSGDGIEKFVTEKLLNEIIEGIYDNKGNTITSELNNQLSPKVLEFEEEIKTINKKLENLGL